MSWWPDDERSGGQDGVPRPPGRAGLPRRSISLGSVFGIPLRMHWTFLVLLALVAVLEWSAGASAVVAGLVWIVGLFAFVVAHELAHSVVARRRGSVVVDILLLPIGGMSQLESMPEDPRDELAVAIAGPLASLAIGVVLLGAAAAAGASLWPPDLVAGSWFARFGWMNLLLGAFNLLPALPMDGGRVLRAALARHQGRVRATMTAARVARALAIAMIVVGLFYDLWLILIGFFVLVGASSEEAEARARSRREPPPEVQGPWQHQAPAQLPPWPPPPWPSEQRRDPPWPPPTGGWPPRVDAQPPARRDDQRRQTSGHRDHHSWPRNAS